MLCLKLTWECECLRQVTDAFVIVCVGGAIHRMQVKCLGKWGAFSFCWSLFKWFFTGFGASCGFDTFPSFGFAAKLWKCADLIPHMRFCLSCAAGLDWPHQG